MYAYYCNSIIYYINIVSTNYLLIIFFIHNIGSLGFFIFGKEVVF